MARPQYFLIAGGVLSALISLLHVVLAVQPSLYRYISAGQESELARMAEQGSTPTTIATAVLAVMFAIWAAYAFSGAGLIVRLPLLRAALIAIGAIFILRALFIPTEIGMVVNEGYPIRFVVFSTISLVAGLLYLAGIVTRRASLA
jgi:hypothetical protein